ncbi:MAG: hypothetical protein ACOCWO_03340, partial [Candidatus Muiribacteriaceae bacterium]
DNVQIINSDGQPDCIEFLEGMTQPVHGSQIFRKKYMNTDKRPEEEKSIYTEKIISTLNRILESGTEDLNHKEVTGNKKDIFIYILRRNADMTLKQIGDLTGVKYKTVSKRNSRFKLKLKKSEKLRDHVLQIENRLSQKLTEN